MKIERYDTEKIRLKSVHLLKEHGLAIDDAALLVDSMLEADMAGTATHGIRMLPAYLEKIDNGFFSKEKIEVIKTTAAFTVVDAHNSIGALSAARCADIAIRNAKQSGLHVVFSKNGNTFGAASYFTNRIAKEDLIGIAFSNSPAAMPVANGAEPLLGTNPLAFSCPTKSYGPIMMDMATSVVAKSRLGLYKQEGKLIPEGWALDKQGHPTNDPEEGIKGLILPMAGFKGYEIAMMIDIISGVLSGAGFLNRVNKFYSVDNKPMNVGQTFIAIEPNMIFGDDFLNEMDQYIEIIRNSKTVEDKKVIVPGDRRKELKETAVANGIVLEGDTAEKLAKIFICSTATNIDFNKMYCRV